MRREDIRICVLRVGGTNCDAETARSFRELGTQAEVIHASQLAKKENLRDYSVLAIPGGFAYGDYVRAGAIWAKWIVAKLGRKLKSFVDEDCLILGICNGFQVLVEAGLLPGIEGMSRYPEAALAKNVPPGYNCRWIWLKHESKGKCVFTRTIRRGDILRMPVAHSEGRFMFSRENERKFLKKLYDEDQLVLRYCDAKGQYAEGKFPDNPNGSLHDIAAICNPEGTVFGLMPHPERAFYWWQKPDWTSERPIDQRQYGDGKLIFDSIIQYLEKKS